MDDQVQASNAAWNEVVRATPVTASEGELRNRYLVAIAALYRPYSPQLAQQLEAATDPGIFERARSLLGTTTCSFERFCSDVRQHGSNSPP